MDVIKTAIEAKKNGVILEICPARVKWFWFFTKRNPALPAAGQMKVSSRYETYYQCRQEDSETFISAFNRNGFDVLLRSPTPSGVAEEKWFKA